MGWHENTVEEIKQKLGSNFLKDSLNLPIQTHEGALYKPDIVVIEKTSNKIVAIIEVETARVRKAICGAAILANTVISESTYGNAKIYDKAAKPTLYFVVQEDMEERERKKLKERLNRIMNSIKEPQVKEIKLCTEPEFMGNDLKKILEGAR